MSWADRAKQALASGETTTVRPRGHSKKPKVNGNNRGHINDWVGPKAVYGRAAKVERP